MNYNLTDQQPESVKIGVRDSLVLLLKHMRGSVAKMSVSFLFLLGNSFSLIITPFLVGDVTNKFIPTGDKEGLISSLILLAGIYLVGTLFSYLQIRLMGQVGQTIVYNIRKNVFNRLQALPLQFFNQNRSGDLISRINNDTEKMNQAFSETLLRFTGDVVVIAGIAVVMVYLNWQLGLLALASLALMLIFTWIVAGWIKSRNDRSLQKLGELSGQIQESLSNFKVTVVFNRRDYFRESFAVYNEETRHAATWAAIANGLLAPVYNFAGTFASGIILVVGIQLLILDKVASGQAPEFGTLLAFILYTNAFFGPLKELGDLISQLQVAIASWSRIYLLLKLENNLPVLPKSEEVDDSAPLLELQNVSFGYDPENLTLKQVNMRLERGKTYALVGPTGGGKSTTASLMVRLYDATEGKILLKGRDIRSYEKDELAQSVGFILQEPFLFNGTLAENIRYGNNSLDDLGDEQISARLDELGLGKLVARFSEGLQTQIEPGAENISLGQRQLISFVRALLRQPELLILDEATANVDTVTEQILEEIIDKLPPTTTKVIIAHRLNTIEKANQIFFISNGEVENPLDFKSALELINHANGKS